MLKTINIWERFRRRRIGQSATRKALELYDAQDYAFKQLKQQGAQDIVLSAISSSDTQIKFANNDIATTKDWRTQDIDAFIAIGERSKMRVASGTIAFETKAKIDQSIQHLINFAKLTPVDTNYYAIAEGPYKYKKIGGLYDHKIASLGTKSIDIVNEAIGRAVINGAVRCAGVLDYGISTTRLITSNNVRVVDQGTEISLSLRALAAKDASCHRIVVGNTLSDFHFKKEAAEAGRFAAQARGPKVLPPGKYDVIFGSIPVTNLFGSVAASSSMTAVETDMSFFADKLGKVVADKQLTIYDWGNKPHGIESAPYDDEGRPTQKTTLIQRGVLKNFLHNTSTAHRHNTKSTSNAGILYPAASNLVVSPGRYSLDGMISRVKNGLYITNTWYTRFHNYRTGEFSTLPRDAIFQIRNGRLAESVKGIRVSDSMLNILKNISAIGNAKISRRIVGWDAEQPTEAPPILVKKVNITHPK